MWSIQGKFKMPLMSLDTYFNYEHMESMISVG
jgi:hypothetical protein